MRVLAPICLGVCLLMSGCSGSKAEIISSGERYVAATPGGEQYRLGVGDKVRVTIYNEAPLSGEFAVGSGGAISLPLIGEVPAVGRTVRDFATDAERRFADGYLRMPKVSAEVSVYRPFFILGEVSAPGQYPYSVGLTAYSAIATAKGYTPRGNQDVVRIRREGEAEEKQYRVTPSLRIYPGDVVRVGERFF